MKPIIAIDTETTGLDLKHGCMPYLITTCDEEGRQVYWEFDVNPKTRKPIVSKEFREEFFEVIDGKTKVFLNAKYDIRALHTIIPNLQWDWKNTHDCSMLAHLLNSLLPRNLTALCITYLRTNISHFEDALSDPVKASRRFIKKELPTWMIARNDLPSMPSTSTDKIWKADMWILRALTKYGSRVRFPKNIALGGLLGALDSDLERHSTWLQFLSNHPWNTLVSDYANCDSLSTLMLFKHLHDEMEDRGYSDIYEERNKLIRVAYLMEERGITCNADRKQELSEKYREESNKCERVCVNIAKSYSYELSMPKSGNNHSLSHFLFGEPKYADSGELVGHRVHLNLPVISHTPTGAARLNKEDLDNYTDTLPERSKALTFIRNLKDKRKRDTALSYMDSYERFWLPTDLNGPHKVIHPSLFITGTKTTRWSSSNPNEQNISKKEGFNIRYVFGPAPGREWWALDYDNLELRLPAYESGEQVMIDIFERPNDPPYFGSYHMLIFDILHPEKYAKYGPKVKEQYSTWYGRTKNGNFAEQYGAIDKADGSGTADRAYGIPGAQAIVSKRLKNKTELNNYWIEFATKNGYVETMPDRLIDPHKGYPLVVPRNDRGGILQTVPLNYHVQGTACWVIATAMVECQEYLDELNSSLATPEYFMIIQVHDELVFDFPYRPDHGNLPIIQHIRCIMESKGERIGVPLTCGLDYITEDSNWSAGVSL